MQHSLAELLVAKLQQELRSSTYICEDVCHGKLFFVNVVYMSSGVQLCLAAQQV